MALFVTNDQQSYSGSESMDHLSIVANLQALLSFSSDIMLAKDDIPTSVMLKGSKHHIFMFILEWGTLLVTCRKSANLKKAQKRINQTVSLLEKVCTLISNLDNRQQHLGLR
eukprot:TRINITY_DN2730_c0_g1_i2.p2 TRINITY_DN2730_c0_g1~~TRINITY_DN2730_c0_g1_i2.p2  ORF type:complete len:112 (+),score=32.75 TRINITY_DN2730_c0_g1_i2:629-964(+)